MYFRPKIALALRVLKALEEKEAEEKSRRFVLPRLVSLEDLLEELQVSQSNLEITMSVLVKAGLLESKRGRRGGYKLARNADGVGVYRLCTLRVLHSVVYPREAKLMKHSDDYPSYSLHYSFLGEFIY